MPVILIQPPVWQSKHLLEAAISVCRQAYLQDIMELLLYLKYVDGTASEAVQSTMTGFACAASWFCSFKRSIVSPCTSELSNLERHQLFVQWVE